ncbi:unnamed protein product [Hyaloperonospora brassicae]|uniref:Uncharacterized protein n=1 Tax=Hyaloperonospora brassicae TaxID=162125 RepID=A0AAV0TV37_HYABA|nr:unnamed protein product [Hyaloperonospora brassicae]
MELQDAVAIVTGGARGFGRAFADKILAARGKVLITDVDVQELRATGEALQAQYGEKNVCWRFQDVTEKDSFSQAFAYASEYFHEPVNVLVNNAGVFSAMSFYEHESTYWETIVDIDLIAPIRGTRCAIAEFKRTLNGKEGVVVNVASMAGLVHVPFAPDYAAAKHGVVGLTRSLYTLQKSDNIRCFCMCPGFADTDMGRNAEETVPEYTSIMGGLLPVQVIVDAFVAGLREPDNAGRVQCIMHDGIMYHSFPTDKVLSPTPDCE